MQIIDAAAAIAHYKASVPDDLFQNCAHCGATLNRRTLDEYQVCPHCQAGLRLGAHARLKLLTKQFTEWDSDIVTTDPLAFPGYDQKLAKARQAAGMPESVLTGLAQLNQSSVALGIMDSHFMMGSLGTATGTKLTRLFERATAQRLPVILFCASGGARMQEGTLSLMQMAKISAAVNQHSQAGLPYFTVLTDPTTGGVSASFAMQGDVTLAEPHSLVGFAGRRVIEQTIGKRLPADFQSAEQVLKNGYVDQIVPRQELLPKLCQLLKLHGY